MPIVFVHGVNVRQDEFYEPRVTQRNLRIKEQVLRDLGLDPDKVKFFTPYWGQYAASLAWQGSSLPGGSAQTLDLFQNTTPDPEEEVIELLLSGTDTTLPTTSNHKLLALANSSLAAAVDLLFALATDLVAINTETDELAELMQLAARVHLYVERHPKPAWIGTVSNDQEFIARLREAVDAWQAPPQSLGLGDIWDNVHEGLDRFTSVAGNFGSRALLSLTRKPLNTAVSHFIGDVFVYLDERGERNNPGPIIREIATHLDAAMAAITPKDPYLIVIAHSMGGNITYDLLTYFAPDTYDIDLFITVGSQVALFEELKLYRASQRNIPVDPRQERVAKPAAVKHWLNVYDPNDVLSFAAAGVFDGVTDFVYATGKSVIAAHTAYFLRGSFYRRLAGRVKQLLQP